MIPGGRVNPRQMKQAMKRMGIKAEEIDDVEEVIIRTSEQEYVITEAAVTKMEVQGQVTFQIIGEYEIRGRTDAETGPSLPEEDISLVMDQTGCTREQATEALEATNGQPAEAILKIVSS